MKGAVIQGLSVGSINGLFPCAWALVRLPSGLQAVLCCGNPHAAHSHDVVAGSLSSAHQPAAAHRPVASARGLCLSLGALQALWYGSIRVADGDYSGGQVRARSSVLAGVQQGC